MPDSPEADLKKIEEEAMAVAKKNGAIGQMQFKEEPIAFGLKAVLILVMYTVDEDKDFEGIASEMQKIAHVQSTEVYQMDLALG